jgi:hypothetical protein
LIGPVKGDVASPVAFENFDVALGKQLGRGDYVCRFRVAAEGYDRRVLKEQERVPNAAFFPQRDELLLKAKTGCVIDSAELNNRNHNKTISPQRTQSPQRNQIPYAFIANPYTLFDASSMASANVGCAWIVHIRSSTVASSSMAVTASAMSSVACGPMM